jgi:hypothetical protein
MIFLLFLAFAENPKVIYKEKTEIDFEALDIEGKTKKPVITNVSGADRATFHSLIVPRQDFIIEMGESLDDIK